MQTIPTNYRHALAFLAVATVAILSSTSDAQIPDPAGDRLPGTRLLTMEGDIASNLVEGVDKFLLRELRQSVTERARYWKRDTSSAEAYDRSVDPNRQRLAHRLGVRDERSADPEPQFVSSISEARRVGRGEGYGVYAIRWAAFGDVSGRGLMLMPNDREPAATVVAIPDCDTTPEQLVGLVAGVPPESQFARRFAENGCRVIVPLLVNREEHLSKLTHREWLYRSAFEMGRGLIGYEVQQVLALVDWATKTDGESARVGVFGWGEGGLISLYSSALDPRIDVAGVSGYFAPRQSIWREPLDRNVFGLLEEFGDAELATLVAPRPLIIEAAAGPRTVFEGGRGAPARVVSPKLTEVDQELERARSLWPAGGIASNLQRVVSGNGQGPYGSDHAVQAFLDALVGKTSLVDLASDSPTLLTELDLPGRHEQHIHELDRHTQFLLRESHYLRDQTTMKRFDFTSVDAYQRSASAVRDDFYDHTIGRFKHDLLPPGVRSRKFKQTVNWTAYEVVMDVFPDVFAYGLLLVPNDLDPGERRPVVVCQHGLEGRPQDTIGEQGKQAYQAFAAELADRGFVTFAPQNLYIFEDRFRTLQRKANPLKKTLFSIITPQHQQIVNWLGSLEFVDKDRIGFYGLSYGGKTAMRVPAIVTEYCLSICSADFNEWVDKNASTRNPRSYVNFGEYEIFEFDLGSTFNYAEMAALIAPRPFMVERGHFDGVADDWTVAYEYAKIRNLYAARLGLASQTEIEWFVGPHTINGKATFDFLSRHLNWPRAATK